MVTPKQKPIEGTQKNKEKGMHTHHYRKPSNHKGREQEKNQRYYKTARKKTYKIIVSLLFLIISLNIKGLNSSNQNKVVEWSNKNKTPHFRYKDTDWKWRKGKNTFQYKMKVGLTMLISDKIDFNKRVVMRQKKIIVS